MPGNQGETFQRKQKIIRDQLKRRGFIRLEFNSIDTEKSHHVNIFQKERRLLSFMHL